MQKKHFLLMILVIMTSASIYWSCTKESTSPIVEQNISSQQNQANSNNIESTERSSSVVLCTTGDCTYSIRVISVLPQIPGTPFAGYSLDVSRFHCNRTNTGIPICENFWNQTTLPIGGQPANFPVDHDSQLGILGQISNSLGGPIPGIIRIRITRADGSSSVHNIVSASLDQLILQANCPGIGWRRFCGPPPGE
jgi:hypothetical protein